MIKKKLRESIYLMKYHTCKNKKGKSYNSKYAYDYLTSKRHFDFENINVSKKEILNEEDIIFDLSIIIPAYNVEEYICECIDSIINQNTTYTYEIIIINDGSKDSTLDKINLYKGYNNLKIISQENGGISRARNKGIDSARGKFLMFVDSDDILIENSIETLLKLAYENKADIVEGGYQQFTNNNEIRKIDDNKQCIRVNEYKNNPDYIFNQVGFPWGKIYAHDLWKDVRFPEGLEFEDTIIMYILLRTCNRHIYVSNCVYGYRNNPNSITQRVKKGYLGLDSLYVVAYIMEMIKQLGVKNDYTVYKLTLYQLGKYLYGRTRHFDEELQYNMLIVCKEIILNIQNYRPKNLEPWLDKLESSIIDINLERWKICSRVM